MILGSENTDLFGLTGTQKKKKFNSCEDSNDGFCAIPKGNIILCVKRLPASTFFYIFRWRSQMCKFLKHLLNLAK